MSRTRLVLFTFGLLFLIGVFLLIGFGYFLVTPAEKDGEDQVFRVRHGATLRQVAGTLEGKDLITSQTLFLLWARTMGYGRQIKAGEYLLNPSMSPVQILNRLHTGEVITHAVTIPEGFTCRQIGQLLARRELVDRAAFSTLSQDPAIARRYGISGPGLEGYLYPDTYHFARGLSAMEIIDVMVRRFHEVIAVHRDRIDQISLSLEEVVTLASIVEKETGSADERPVIASVFLNRLERHMRLESDPTVIYGIESFDGNLRRADLMRPTPYNTYLIRGLPPGPIANPGEDALLAVLYPAETSYLYFVSKNDGTHHFSETFGEHNQAVRRYQKKSR